MELLLEFCHIAPTAYLETFCAGQRSHLVLAHLVEEDETYRNFYITEKSANPNCNIILDNSAFEMYKRGLPMYDSDKLVEMAKLIDADYVVMSDYPNEPWEKTRDKAVEMIPVLKENGIGTFFCPQAPIKDYQGLVDSYQWAVKQPDIDYIALSILNMPNFFGVEKDNKLQRYLSRMMFAEILERNGWWADVRKFKKKIHFLGMTDGPQEITLCSRWLSMITTWDSSAAIWAGLNGISFDMSPTGLEHGKFETHVDFNFTGASETNINIAWTNIHFIEDLIYENS